MMRNETTNVKCPCHECTYVYVCGDDMRTQPCAGFQLNRQPEKLTEINDPDNVLVSVTWSYTDLLVQLTENGYEDDTDNLKTLIQQLDTRYMQEELIKLGNEHIVSAIDQSASVLKRIQSE